MTCLGRSVSSLYEPQHGYSVPKFAVRFRQNTVVATDHLLFSFTFIYVYIYIYTRGVFKKRPNFLNSAPTSLESALRLLSATSVRFWQQTAICPVSLWALVVELHPLNWARAQAVRRISDKEDIQKNATTELRAITESAFQEAFQQWKKRWERCIASRGDYFEGDSA
jgi:hypothetical protein